MNKNIGFPKYYDYNCNAFFTKEDMCSFHNISVDEYDLGISKGLTVRQILTGKVNLDENDMMEDLILCATRKDVTQISTIYNIPIKDLKNFINNKSAICNEKITDEVIKKLIISKATKHLNRDYFNKMYNIDKKRLCRIKKLILDKGYIDKEYAKAEFERGKKQIYYFPKYIDYKGNGYNTKKEMCDAYNISVEDFDAAINNGATIYQALEQKECLNINDLIIELNMYAQKRLLQDISKEYGFELHYFKDFMKKHRGENQKLNDTIIRELRKYKSTNYLTIKYFIEKYNLPKDVVLECTKKIKMGEKDEMIKEYIKNKIITYLPNKNNEVKKVKTKDKVFDNIFYTRNFIIKNAQEYINKHSIKYLCERFDHKPVNISYVINYYNNYCTTKTFPCIARELELNPKLLAILLNKTEFHKTYGEKEEEIFKLNAPYVRAADFSILFNKSINFIRKNRKKYCNKVIIREPEAVQYVIDNYQSKTIKILAEELKTSQDFVMSIVKSNHLLKEHTFLGGKQKYFSYGRYVSLEKKIYEEHHGKSEVGAKIIFINGDTSDYSAENLTAITISKERRNKLHSELVNMEPTLRMSYIEAYALDGMSRKLGAELRKKNKQKIFEVQL